MGLDRQDVCRDFDAAVNMTAAELERWLGTDESRQVGWMRESDVESIGHQAGRQIVDILHRRGALQEDDYVHMRKVTGVVHRHLAQRPEGDVTDTRWRHSLMNWGHDPLKDRQPGI